MITAKGSGRRKTSRLDKPSAATTGWETEPDTQEAEVFGTHTCNPDLFPARDRALVRQYLRNSGGCRLTIPLEQKTLRVPKLLPKL